MAAPASDEIGLDVTEEQIARTYAQGFLGAVADAAEAEVADLVAVRDEVLRPHPKLLETLASAFLDHDERIAIVDRVLGGRVTSAVLNLVKVLSEHGRIGLLGRVATQAERLYDESQNRVHVLVRLAQEPNDELLGQVESVVRSQMGIEPMLRVEVDPSLVGGLEVRVGDTVFDGSIRTAFAKAHKSIVNQTIQAIENEPERFTVAG